jgi:dolichol-phosphate mannosyltransferase
MVIITLPAYNEEESLPLLLERVEESMGEDDTEYRVIVVNDGSTDGTAAVTDALEGRMPLERIDHDTNRGLGEAVRTGLLHALGLADDRDIIVTMDSDNTHTPGLIPGMVRRIREGNDVVIASRFRPGAHIMGVPLYRRVLSRAGSWCFRVEIYGRQFVTESGFSCMVDILLKLRSTGAIMTELPLVLRYDYKYGVSKMLVLRTVFDTLKLLVARRLGLDRA